MGSSTRMFAATGSALLIVIMLAGWGLKSLFGHSKQPTQVVNPYMPQGQPGAAMPDMAKLASLGGMGGNQAVMMKLMTAYRMNPRAASYLSETKIKVVDETNTSVHYVLTFPDGVTSDESVAITPDQHYTPTPAELQRLSRRGPRIFSPKLTQKKVSEDEVHFTLHYYVQQDTLPPNLLERIRKGKATASSTDFFSIVPAARAQQGGGDNGAGFVEGNIAELEKSMAVKGLEHAEWEKAAKGLDNILTLKDLVVGYGEISEWLGEVQELDDCAKHPTNPLTQKAAQSQEYQQQVIGGLNEASWDVQMTAFPKVANIAAGAVTQFLPFGTGVLISPITAANDEAIAQIAEERIADAKKMVVPCDKPVELTAGAFRPMKGAFEYKYSLNDKGCLQQEAQGGCSFHTTTRMAEGKLSLNPDNFGLLVGSGSGTMQEQAEMHVDKTKASSRSTKAGAVVAEFKCGGSPESGVVQMTIHGEALTFDEQDQGAGGQALAPIHMDDASFATSCEFRNVDFTKGGTYSAFSQDDNHGTCKLELGR